MSTYGRDHYKPGRVPKVVRCNAGRDEAALYKNLGNSNRIKFMWAETVTLDGVGQYVVIASGTYGAGKTVNKPDHYAPGAAYYGKTIDDLYIYVTGQTAHSGNLWVDVDLVADTVTIKSTSGKTDAGDIVDVLFFST